MILHHLIESPTSQDAPKVGLNEANELYIGPQVPPDMAKALGLECTSNESTARAGDDEAEASLTAAAAGLEASDAAARAQRRRGLEASEVRTWERDAKFLRLQEEARRHMQRALLGDDAGADDTSPSDEQLSSATPGAGAWDANALAAYSAQLSSNSSLPVRLLMH